MTFWNKNYYESDRHMDRIFKLNKEYGIIKRLAGQDFSIDSSSRLHEAYERTRLLLDAMPLACHLWNRDLVMFECNEENKRLFDLADKNEVKDSFSTFSPQYQPDGRLSSEKAADLIRRAFAEGEVVVEWMHQLRDGTPIPTEISLVRVPYGDDYVVAGYARDLRLYKKMLEEIKLSETNLETANNAKSDFLARMSHEMRTPLNAVIGLSGLVLEMDCLDEEAEKNLEKVYNAGATLLNIVNDILDISKIEAGKFELIPGEYDIPSLINDTITQNSIRIGEKPIEFTLVIDAGMPTRLYGDDLRIKQILSNLLSNAFKYTREGQVEFGIKCECGKESDDVWVTAWVKDTGKGIRPEYIDQLFSNYSQMDAKANHYIEGTGLGLAITKKMVEAMDGMISVESVYGKGSVFTVSFKQKFVTATPIGDTVAENLRSFKYTDNKRKNESQFAYIKLPNAKVLVVDDIQTNLDVSKGLMKPYGMHIDCVTSGQDAVDAIRFEKIKYDAVFMDHMMPEMDGVEALQHIRQIDTDYARNVPIIALTANAIIGNEKMLLEKGFQAFLSKPVQLKQLDVVIKHWVRDASPHASISAPPDGAPWLQDAAATTEAEAAAASSDAAATAAAAAADAAADAIEIPGIDADYGLSLYAGMRETYLPILRSYAENMPAVVDALRRVTNDSLHDYAIKVHGLKGSSAGIGAEGIRERAYALEMLSKSGDLRGVLGLNGTFIRDVDNLIKDIREWLDKHDQKAGKPRLKAPDPAILHNLRKCLNDYDMNGIDSAMELLKTAEYEENTGLMEWLEEKITESDYAEAAQCITNVLDVLDILEITVAGTR